MLYMHHYTSQLGEILLAADDDVVALQDAGPVLDIIAGIMEVHVSTAAPSNGPNGLRKVRMVAFPSGYLMVAVQAFVFVNIFINYNQLGS